MDENVEWQGIVWLISKAGIGRSEHECAIGDSLPVRLGMESFLALCCTHL